MGGWFWDTLEWASYCRAYGLPGPVNNSHDTNIVVPLGSIDRMLANMRKGHRYDINHPGHLDAQWPTSRPAFDAYQRLHEKDAGRKTRPQATFDIMFDWIAQCYVQLLLVYAMDFGRLTDARLAGASLWITYDKGVYYASSAREPELKSQYKIGHFMVWSAMQHFAALGYEWLDLGEGAWTTDKERAIVEFKRGFLRHREP